MLSRIVTFLRQRSIESWIAVLVFLGALFYLSAGANVGAGRDDPGFDIDEAHKLAESYYYHLFFESFDWGAPAWSEDFYARTNPPVAKYVFGLTLALAGLHVHDQNLQRDFDRLWTDPQRLRARVPDPMLRVTRATSLFFAVLVCVLAALIAGRVGGPVAALLAPVWLLADATFTFVARAGLTDSIMLFHLLLIVPVSQVALRAFDGFDVRRPGGAGGWSRFLMLAVAVPALVIALAAGTKLNGAFAAPAYALAMLCGASIGEKERLWARVGNVSIVIAATAVVSFAIFVLINPYFHAQTVERMLALPGTVQNWMVKQQLSPGGGLFDLREKIATAGWVTLLSPYLAGHRLAGAMGTGFGVVAVGAGLIVLARTCVVAAPGDDPAKRDRRRAAVAAACWIVVVTLLVTAWAPLARIRYFLPPALAVGILFAIGFAGVSMLLLRRAFDRGRIAIAAIALALGTAGVYGVVDPTVLDLQRLGVPVSREGLEAYRDSASRHPDSSLRHRRLGFLLMYAGEPESAVDELNVALQLLPTETRDVKIAVQRAITAYDLARAYARAGDHQRSLAALRQHLSIVNELRGRVLDPYVRREFDAVIAERTPGSP